MLQAPLRASAVIALLLAAAGTHAFAATSGTQPSTLAAPAASPSATPTPTPRWVYNGKAKAYYYTRQNASNSTQDGANTTQINQATFALGLAPHVEYHPNSFWTFGATYWYINPFNGVCETPESHLTAPCKVVVPKSSLPTGSELNFDDSVPAYQVSALNEAYVQFQNSDLYAKLGNQVLNTPWAGANASRIMPSSYQAVDGIYKLNGAWQIEAADSWKFLPITQSSFTQTTLLTQLNTPYSQGFGGIAPNLYDPSEKNITTPGFGYGRLGYASGDLTANLHIYDIYDITSIDWLDAKYTASKLALHPYVAIQGGVEHSLGSAVAGQIDSSLVGIEGGVNLNRNFVLQAAYDGVPTRTTSLVLPKGFSCSSTTHEITSPKNNTGSLPYFLPYEGSPNCDTVGGVTTLYTGGWATPYSDGYATDPLFTSSPTQGLAVRRSPGQTYKLFLIGTSTNKRLVATLAYAGYDYNQPVMAAPTDELTLDTTYYFNKPATGNRPYKGFLFSYKYGDRAQPYTNAALPLFKYSRFQSEYDF